MSYATRLAIVREEKKRIRRKIAINGSVNSSTRLLSTGTCTTYSTSQGGRRKRKKILKKNGHQRPKAKVPTASASRGTRAERKARLTDEQRPHVVCFINGWTVDANQQQEASVRWVVPGCGNTSTKERHNA